MSLVINHNLMALNSSRNLAASYSRLATSTRRMSSGLRVGQAADDAAGLSVRELMRADIASLNQGVRNANDSVSLIQTADGALQVLDEKLVRMEELAEQAATGTYNSDQRLMIDSEYQQMAKEISRIANSTDFNGVHLLNGNLESGYHNGHHLTSTGKLKVHFGTGNDSAEDYYYIQIEDMTAEGLSIGDGGTVDVANEKLKRKFALNLEELLRPGDEVGGISEASFQTIVAEVWRSIDAWTAASRGIFATDPDFYTAFTQTFGASTLPRETSFTGPEGFTYAWLEGMDAPTPDYANVHASYKALTGDEKQKYRYAFLRQSVRNMAGELASGYIFSRNDDFRMDDTIITIPLQSVVQQAGREATGWFDRRHTYAGQNLRTQENAQHALEAIEAAIIIKDKVRASLGATQNRLENTISNLRIQGENLQAAESRVSDVDVAAEMTEFLRQQVLSQAAVAMLAQANNLPRMALSLLWER
jgi:flagellin